MGGINSQISGGSAATYLVHCENNANSACWTWAWTELGKNAQMGNVKNTVAKNPDKQTIQDNWYGGPGSNKY